MRQPLIRLANKFTITKSVPLAGTNVDETRGNVCFVKYHDIAGVTKRCKLKS